jgi:hypothetical protein
VTPAQRQLAGFFALLFLLGGALSGLAAFSGLLPDPFTVLCPFMAPVYVGLAVRWGWLWVRA